MGWAPRLSPPHPDFVTAMGRTNDAIIYGGRAQLYVTGPAEDAQGFSQRRFPVARRAISALPSPRFSGASKAISTPSIPCSFSPAEVIVTAIESGESFHSGAVHHKLLDASFA